MSYWYVLTRPYALNVRPAAMFLSAGIGQGVGNQETRGGAAGRGIVFSIYISCILRGSVLCSFVLCVVYGYTGSDELLLHFSLGLPLVALCLSVSVACRGAAGFYSLLVAAERCIAVPAWAATVVCASPSRCTCGIVEVVCTEIATPCSTGRHLSGAAFRPPASPSPPPSTTSTSSPRETPTTTPTPKKQQAGRKKVESEKARAEVAACLSRLTDQVEHNSEIAQAKEEAEKRARAAALEVEHAETAAARTEVETSLRLMVESLERDAAVANAKEEAERLVQREAEARQAAEIKAAEAAEEAEEAARARQQEDRVKEDARRALQAEAELLRSKLQEAGEEAAERAQEEAQARAHKEAQELRQAEEQAEREARLVEEAKRAAEREVEMKEAADRDTKTWEEKFQALQREREEEAQKAKEELARAVEEAKEFEKAEYLALRAAEARRGCGAGGGDDDGDGGGCASVALVVPRFLWTVFGLLGSEACSDKYDVVGFRRQEDLQESWQANPA